MKPITIGQLRALVEAGLDSGLLDTLTLVAIKVVHPPAQALLASPQPTVREVLGITERKNRKRGKRSGLNALQSLQARITEDRPKLINTAYMKKWLLYEGFAESGAHYVLNALTKGGFLRKLPAKHPTHPGVWVLASEPETAAPEASSSA